MFASGPRILLLFAAFVCFSPLAAAQTAASIDLAQLSRSERVALLRSRTWDVRAARVEERIIVDGRLDEDDWARAEPITDFYQGQRNEGLPASERTAVRLLYDDKQLYVGFRAWDSEPDRIAVRSIFRDEAGGADDLVSILLDAYHGHRSAIQFVTNANGLAEDLLQTGETSGTRNHDWDAVWHAKGRRLVDGFEVEVAIPFKSLRFEAPTGSEEIVFGIGFKRNIPRRNEESTWPFVPNDSTWYRPAELGHVRGLTQIHPGRNFEIRPYVLGSGLRDFAAQTPARYKREAGIDAKWGVTTGMTADFTVNTDFAQEEADIQQVNLTRFSLFFPEKRQFFLEGQQAFRFGQAREADVIFTRRIGLAGDGTAIPILGGARLSGRQGRTTVGVMNLQTRDTHAVESQNFTVMRVRRDVFSRSSVGAVFTNVQGDGRFNRVYGADANLYVKRVWFFDFWGARVDQTGGGPHSSAGYSRVAYDTDRRGFSYTFLGVGESFEPGVGYVQRPDSRRHSTTARWSPRPAGQNFIRQYHVTGSLSYITNGRNIPETRDRAAQLRAEFETGDAVQVAVTNNMENLLAPFRLRSNILLPAGTYTFNELVATFDSFRRRHLQLDTTWTSGGFYNGQREALSMAFNWRLSTQVGVVTNYSVNWIDLPLGAFTTHLVSSRLQLAFRNDLALLTLVQYNRDTKQFASNVRFNWIPKPGTDFFIVFNETDTTHGGLAPRNRSLAVKLNYLFAL